MNTNRTLRVSLLLLASMVALTACESTPKTDIVAVVGPQPKALELGPLMDECRPFAPITVQQNATEAGFRDWYIKNAEAYKDCADRVREMGRLLRKTRVAE